MDFFNIYLPIAGMQFNVLLLLLIGFTVARYHETETWRLWHQALHGDRFAVLADLYVSIFSFRFFLSHVGCKISRIK